MIVIHEGSLTIGDQTITKGGAAVFKPSNQNDEIISLKTSGEITRFIMLAGKPLNEPIASRGPFVLNE